MPHFCPCSRENRPESSKSLLRCFLQKIRVYINCCNSSSIVIKQFSQAAASPSATCVSAQGGVGRAHVSSQSGDKYRQEEHCLLTQSVSVQV